MCVSTGVYAYMCLLSCECMCVCVCVRQRSVLISCHMCKAAVISPSGAWECEEETRWGSRLMKDLHLPHVHTHARTHTHTHTNTYGQTHSEVLLLLRQITWLHGNTLMDHHDKVSIDLPSIIWRHNMICHVVFVHNTRHASL